MQDGNELPASFEGPAFTRGVKVLASVLMIGVAIFGVKAAPAFIERKTSWAAFLFMMLALGCVIVCFVAMLKSRTRINATHIHQTWISDKRVAIKDITQMKLIYVPGLTWLIAPRLIVKARSPGSIVFHTADPQVLAAFARLSMGMPPLS
ncbi:MAG: hypothetical protein JF606_16020 [Burkholderiales bacterium]|nr:hypothetical protein [Burkholderiales bacterium]